MKILAFFVTMLLLIIGYKNARADVSVSSSYGMALSADQVKTLFEQIRLQGEETHTLQDFQIEEPYKTQLKSVVLSGNYEAQLKSGSTLVDFSLSAKMSSLVLRVGRISTDAVINKVVGGINVQVFLKGYCENVEVRSLADTQMTAQLHLSTGAQGLVPKLDGIVLGKISDWSIHMGQCQGPLGYDKALQAEIRNLLSNKSEMQKLIADPFSTKLLSVAQTLNTKILADQSMALSDAAQVSFHPESLQLLGDKGPFLIGGKVIALLKSEQSGEVTVDDAAFLQKLLERKETGLYVSQKWVQESVQKAQSLKLLKYSFTSASIESLKSLFSNRLYQFFLWPDLMSFVRGVLFKFELRLQSLDKFSLVGSSDGALWYDLQGAGSVFTQAPKQSEYVHYGNFSTALKSRVWVKMHKGAAVIGAYNPQFDLKFAWAKKYLQLFNPFKSISVSYFAGKIQSTLKSERYTVVAPKLEVSENVNMVADQISGDADILFIGYSAK